MAHNRSDIELLELMRAEINDRLKYDSTYKPFTLAEYMLLLTAFESMSRGKKPATEQKIVEINSIEDLTIVDGSIIIDGPPNTQYILRKSITIPAGYNSKRPDGEDES